MITLNKYHKRRLIIILLIAILISCAAGLILYSLKENINVFLTPSEVITSKPATPYKFRLGGVVKVGSVSHEQNQLSTNFIVTDFKHDIPIHYVGILPDLFREAKGVIAEGRLDSQGVFNATMVLAKHDENYMPQSMYKKIQETNK